MQNEHFFYDGKIKGHRLLISDQIVSYKGRTLQTARIQEVGAIAHSSSVNGIPKTATFIVVLSDGQAKIHISCALGLGTFGRKNYEQVKAAAFNSAGVRLIQEAVQDLRADKAIRFERPSGMLTRGTSYTISKAGLEIAQDGFVGAGKRMLVPWEHLRFEVYNGSAFITNYKTKEKVRSSLWDMPNNLVFQNLVLLLLERAN